MVALLVAAGLLPVPAACSSGGAASRPATPAPSAGAGTPLDQAQALELASVLYEDYQAGGAQVRVELDYQAGTTVGMAGTVDFVGHEGHLTVTTVVAGSGTSVEDVDYTRTTVFERGGPVVQAELAAHGQPGQTWVSRPADPTDRPVDKVIEVLVSLASPARDNPLLVQQSQARFLATTTLNGEVVDEIRYSPAITYDIIRATGQLAAFVGSVAGFAGPVTVLFSHFGPVSVGPPPPSAVLSTNGG